MRACRFACTVIVVLAGCAAPQRPGSPNDEPRDMRQASNTAGVEVQVWSLRDQPRDADAAITPAQAADATRRRTNQILGEVAKTLEGISPERAQVWKTNGLRVFTMETSELRSLQERLGAQRSRANVALSPGTQWSEVYRAPGARASDVVSMPRGTLSLSGGSLALMMRAWDVPGTGQNADGARTGAMRVELAPQLRGQNVEAPSLRDVLEGTQPRAAGPMQSLALDVLAQGKSMVIVPEDPRVRWGDEETGEAAIAEQPQPEHGTSSALGPVRPRLASIGEAMLGDVFERPRTGVRTILVLTPRVRPTFSLR